MKNEMQNETWNQKLFQETFRKVHAPQGLAERVMNMEEVKSKKKAGPVAKWLAVAAVAAVVLFVGSNGVAYATTGSTWVETLVYKITVNGVEYDVDMEEHQKANGDIWYSGSIQHENGDVTEVEYQEYGEFSTLMIHTKESAGLSLKDDRIRLVDGGMELDITEELYEKGIVSGSYEQNGYTKVYKIVKEGDCIKDYIVTVESSEEDAWNEIEKLEEASKKQPEGVFIDPTPTPKL